MAKKKTSRADIFLGFMLVLVVAVIAADRLYVSRLKDRFQELENERIAASNRLATAKIIDENLHHVRDLVFENMVFPGKKDSLSQEERLFEFVTECVNDLKLLLVSVQPQRNKKASKSGSDMYSLEVEGNFFTVGELCAKFENSRLLISIEELDIAAASKNHDNGSSAAARVRARMLIKTYKVRKS